jgi:glyoxylase-like metal-dependent hydrolase (beta-lactamase superfamily II)
MKLSLPATSAPQLLSRRRFIGNTAFATAAACFTPAEFFAQQAPVDFIAQARAINANNKIVATPLRRNVTVLSGAGGNIAVLLAREGKMVVDSGYASCQPQLTAALAALNDQPIRILINTHWHPDHTDGNDWLHTAGASIWAHENTRYRMSTSQHIAVFNATIPPSPVGALPTTLFNTYRDIEGEGNTVKLNHYEPAHTDTDISVYLAEADILHCGDTWFNGMYPFIDYSTGGNINGMIAAAAQNLSIATDKTIIIPGHGPIGNKAQLAEFHEMLVGVRDNVAAIKQQGKSLEETLAAKPTATYDAKWGTGILKPDLFVTLVYAGV